MKNDHKINSLGGIARESLPEPILRDLPKECSENSSEASQPCGYRGGGKKGRHWKQGGPVSYYQYHLRVRRKRGRPKYCQHCGTTNPNARYEWANLTGHYEDINDYARLCKPCHGRRDLGKLSVSDIEAIRNRCKAGEKQKEIAKDFGIDPSLVSKISRGKYPRGHKEPVS